MDIFRRPDCGRSAGRLPGKLLPGARAGKDGKKRAASRRVPETWMAGAFIGYNMDGVPVPPLRRKQVFCHGNMLFILDKKFFAGTIIASNFAAAPCSLSGVPT